MTNALRLLCVALLAVAACTGSLDAPTIVVTPRILAITADRPESNPGESVTVRVLAHDPEGRSLRYRWRACVDPGAIFSGARSDEADAGVPTDAEPADAGPPMDAGPSTGPILRQCVALAGDGPEAVVPGLFSQALVSSIDMLAGATDFDPAVFRAILASAGLPFEVDVDVLAPDGTVLVSGYKRIAITTREPTRNPPPIEYRIAGTLVRSSIHPFGAPFECIVSRPIVLRARERVIFAPQDDPSTWVETFPIWDYAGTISEGRENAYYSWYATTTVAPGTAGESLGGISAETTRPPDRDVFYEAPSQPGTVRVFLVLRDGHLGTRACGFDVEIIPAEE